MVIFSGMVPRHDFRRKGAPEIHNHGPEVLKEEETRQA
jgi:hypothetical protein